jgi:hypothetical protein
MAKEQLTAEQRWSERKDEHGHSAEDYSRVVSDLSDDVKQHLDRRGRFLLAVQLVEQGDPKSYRELEYFCEQLHLYMLTSLVLDGFVELTDKAKADDVTAADEYKDRWESFRKNYERVTGASQGADVVQLPGAGAYL